METLITKKNKIGDLIMNNNVAPNNGLVGVTWICSSKWKLAALLENNLLYSVQELIKASHTSNHQNHHVIS
jgi:hypothetical protein